MAPQTRDQELTEAYRQARAKLHEDVQFIPVFAGLYDPIPMGQNFLNLTLDRTRSDSSGYLRFKAPDFEPRLGLRGGPRSEKEEAALLRETRSDEFTADELFARVPAAVIAGLPGAGKTTILRHFAWRAFEEDPYAVVVYIETRLLDDAHLEAYQHSRGRLTAVEVFGVLAAVALYGSMGPATYSEKQRQAVADTAKALHAAWEDNRTVLLLDAFDEARSPEVRRWLGQTANFLMKRLPKPDEKQPGAGLPPGRCYLSTRVAELDAPDPVTPTECGIFLVKSLEQEQILTIAARRYGGYDKALFRTFHTEIVQRSYVRRIAGTPLSAMLMVFFFEVEGRFARRNPTYRLIVLFMLDRAWQKLKQQEFPYGRVNPFFQEVEHGDYLARRPELALQYRALAYAARRILYHRGPEAAVASATERRTVNHAELVHHLGESIKDERGFIELHHLKAEDIDPAEWVRLWVKENLFIPAGRDDLVFLHSTVLEYFAAESLAPLVQEIGNEGLMNVFDEPAHDKLETLPILCSRDLSSGQAVFKRLAPVNKQGASPRHGAESTLPLRCLAELEAAERDVLDRFRDVDLRRAHAQEIDDRREKDWAYRHVRHFVLMPAGTTDAECQAVLATRTSDLAECIPLCRTTLPLAYLADWRNDGTPLAKDRASLLRKMLDDEAWRQAVAAGFRGEFRIQAVPDSAKAGPEDVAEKYLELCTRYREADFANRLREEEKSLAKTASAAGPLTTCDPANPTDRNLAYFRAAYSRAIAGSYGSPNFKHAEAVRAVAFSPVGDVAVSASADNRLVLWHVASGRELRSLMGHTDSVFACAFSPDGGQLLSGSSDNSLKLWDTGTGAELRSLTGHQGTVLACAFSPDGRQLLSGSSDKTLKLWDAGTGAELRTLTGHQGRVFACAFSPDGSQLLSGSSDNTLKLWDAGTGAELRRLTGHEGAILACAFNPDGHQVLSGSSDKTLKLWDAGTGAELRSLTGHRGYVLACSFSPDGSQLLSGSSDNTLKLWNTGTGAELRSLKGHRRSVRACAFSPDGHQLLSGSEDNTLKLWDAGTGAELRNLTGHQGSVFACAFSPDGQQLLSGSSDNTLKLWDAGIGAELRSLEGHKGYVLACAFSPEGRQLLSGSSDNTVKLWDASTGAELRSLTGHQGPVWACAFSPDGRQLLSGSDDNTLKLWDAGTGAELRSLTGHEGTIRACAFSPDGRQLLSGSFDKTLKLWDASTGAELRRLMGHEGYVLACAFSPDGLQLLSGSFDSTLTLWDAVTGAVLRRFTGHVGRVWACAFSPDGRQLLSGSDDNTLTLWDAETGAALATWNLGWPILGIFIHPKKPQLAVAAMANGILLLVDLNVRD